MNDTKNTNQIIDLHIKIKDGYSPFLVRRIMEYNNLVDYLTSMDSLIKKAEQSDGHANISRENFNRLDVERRLNTLEREINQAISGQNIRVAYRGIQRW